MSWAVSDDSSGIVKVEVAVGSQPYAQQMRAFIALPDPTATAAAVTGQLEHQGTYWVSVRATNGAGLSTTHTSMPVLVDTTPPWPQGIITHAGSGMQRATTSLPCNFSMFMFREQESWLETVEVGLGSSHDAANVRAFQPVSGLPSELTFTGLQLADGLYYCVARATNIAGLVSVASSDAVTVDTSAPTPGAVFDAVVTSLTASDTITAALDQEYQAFKDHLGAVWTGQSDAHSGIVQIAVAVGTGTTAGTRESVLSFDSSPDLTHTNHVEFDTAAMGWDLTEGTRYHVTLRVTNGAGMHAYVLVLLGVHHAVRRAGDFAG